MSPGAFIRALPAPPQAHPGRPDTPCAASPAYPPPSQPTENSIAGCADPPRQSNRAFASASDAKTLNSFVRQRKGRQCRGADLLAENKGALARKGDARQPGSRQRRRAESAGSPLAARQQPRSRADAGAARHTGETLAKKTAAVTHREFQKRLSARPVQIDT